MHYIIKYSNRLLWLLIVIVFCLIITRMVSPDFLAGHSEWNAPPANIAAVLFLVVLLPGTFQRMGINNILIRFVVMWRRTLGISMYFFVLMHFLFLIDYLPWFSDGLVSDFDALTASGITATILLLPALLTSNNFSVRLFKKYWKILQRVTYIALPLIAIHLWQADHIFLMVLYGIVSFIILLSFFVSAYRRNKSSLTTAVAAILTIALAAVATYFPLKLLFKDPQDVVREEELLKNTARVEELVGENSTLKKELKRVEDAAAAEASR